MRIRIKQPRALCCRDSCGCLVFDTTTSNFESDRFFPQRGTKFPIHVFNQPTNRDMATSPHCMWALLFLGCVWVDSIVATQQPPSVLGKSSPVLRALLLLQYDTKHTLRSWMQMSLGGHPSFLLIPPLHITPFLFSGSNGNIQGLEERILWNWGLGSHFVVPGTVIRRLVIYLGPIKEQSWVQTPKSKRKQGIRDDDDDDRNRRIHAHYYHCFRTPNTQSEKEGKSI